MTNGKRTDIGLKAAVPPASGAELLKSRGWFRVNWQKILLASMLIVGATITLSTAAQIKKLRQAATADRTELAQLRAQVSDIARAPSPDAAALDRQRSELVAQIEKLRQAATADRAELAQLRTQVREAARAPSPDAVTLDRQRAELVAEIEKLRQDATADRAELAQLRTQVSEAARAPPPDALDRQRSELVAQIEKLRRQATDNHAGMDRLEKQMDRLEKQFAEAFQPQESSQPQSTATIGTSPDIVLPPDTTPRVILRFARNRDSARTRAATLERSLRAQGLDVVKSGNSPTSSRANEVMYFYNEDRPSAERIAAGLVEATLIQRAFADDGSLPRPGTIEVAIGR
ncbi:hypothetical protein NKI56_08680 [Mesorhizobium sp. M0622]|uniref:hypothetical protein n=1 Tax=unclassified Mesorhizobium TaxID=325217 RepID=UPI00333894C8